MAVTTTINPRVTPIANNDERLPLALWYARAESAGDLSGGDNTAEIKWSRVSPEHLVSLEECSVHVAGAGAARNVQILITTGEEALGGSALVFRWVSTGTLVSGASFPDPNSVRGISLIANPNFAAYVAQFVTPNTNGETLTAQAWGFIWGVKARNLVGGPIRP